MFDPPTMFFLQYNPSPFKLDRELEIKEDIKEVSLSEANASVDASVFLNETQGVEWENLLGKYSVDYQVSYRIKACAVTR